MIADQGIVPASKFAKDLAAYQRLASKHNLNVCWHLPHSVSQKRKPRAAG